MPTGAPQDPRRHNQHLDEFSHDFGPPPKPKFQGTGRKLGAPGAGRTVGGGGGPAAGGDAAAAAGRSRAGELQLAATPDRCAACPQPPAAAVTAAGGRRLSSSTMRGPLSPEELRGKNSESGSSSHTPVPEAVR